MNCTRYIVVSLLVLTASADAYDLEHFDKLKKTGSCVGCDLRGADLRGIIFGKSGFGAHVAADLRGSNLSGANLRGADLNDANLSKARLISAALLDKAWDSAFYTALIDDQVKASLIVLMIKQEIDRLSHSKETLNQVQKKFGKNWSKTDLPDDLRRFISLGIADLTGATLRRVNLSDGILIGTGLRDVDLTGADLSKAVLIKANLTGAILTNTNLSDADLAYADLKEVVFEPSRDKLPDRFSIRKARNLHAMTFSSNPDGLVELRNVFRKSGRRDLERQITFAINKRQRKRAGGIENLFQYVFFELTCDFGMSPGRPLWILLGLIAVFAVPYMGAIYASGQKDWGVWRVWPEDRIHDRNNDKEPLRVNATGYHVPLWAIYFSLLSAFHIGWRDLNAGAWIARIHPQEFTLRATGWVKVISGIQSLISVYLLALWVFTYFGRPFE